MSWRKFHVLNANWNARKLLYFFCHSWCESWDRQIHAHAGMPPIKWIWEHLAINPYRLSLFTYFNCTLYTKLRAAESCYYLYIFICHFTQKLDVKLLLQSSFLLLCSFYCCSVSFILCLSFSLARCLSQT